MAKIAVVTGAAQRIGAEIARELHRSGFDIALHYRNSADKAAALVAQLNAKRAGSCHCYRADLASMADIRQLGHAIIATQGGVDLLVNNASGFAATPLQECSEEQFDSMLSSNLKGPYFLIQQLLPALRISKGNVVNIVDVHAEHPLKNYNAYCAAKAGLASLTRSLALELGPDIRVNGVAPGAIIWPEDKTDYMDQELERTLARTPLARMGEPADIARAVRFLACEAPFVTGQILAVDGGRTLAG
jgi:pteridine reductase